MEQRVKCKLKSKLIWECLSLPSVRMETVTYTWGQHGFLLPFPSFLSLDFDSQPWGRVRSAKQPQTICSVCVCCLENLSLSQWWAEMLTYHCYKGKAPGSPRECNELWNFPWFCYFKGREIWGGAVYLSFIWTSSPIEQKWSVSPTTMGQLCLGRGGCDLLAGRFSIVILPVLPTMGRRKYGVEGIKPEILPSKFPKFAPCMGI